MNKISRVLREKAAYLLQGQEGSEQFGIYTGNEPIGRDEIPLQGFPAMSQHAEKPKDPNKNLAVHDRDGLDEGGMNQTVMVRNDAKTVTPRPVVDTTYNREPAETSVVGLPPTYGEQGIQDELRRDDDTGATRKEQRVQ